jgi:hypothetical protein
VSDSIQGLSEQGFSQMPEAEVRAYADLVGRVYGDAVRKLFEGIVARQPAPKSLDLVLDEARRELYREQNEFAATSGHSPFDSDGDL